MNRRSCPSTVLVSRVAAIAVIAVLFANPAHAIWNQPRFLIGSYLAPTDTAGLVRLNNADVDVVYGPDGPSPYNAKQLIDQIRALRTGMPGFDMQVLVAIESGDDSTFFKNSDGANPTHRAAVIGRLNPARGLNDAGVFGYSLWDEPPLYYGPPPAPQLTDAQIFATIHAMTATVRDSTTAGVAQDKLPFTNQLGIPPSSLFPQCSTDLGEMFKCYLDEYLSSFNSDALPAPVLCADQYPFETSNADSTHYFLQLQILRDKTIQYSRPQYRIPLWFVIQSSPRRDNMASPYKNTPTFNQTRWQAFVALAYGAKAIWYWTTHPIIWNPQEVGYGASYFDSTGAVNHPLYDSLTVLNHELHAVGGPLMYLEPLVTYHQAARGFVMPAGEGLLSDPAKSFNLAATFAAADSEGMVGYFKSATHSRDYLLVVNNDRNASHNFTLTLGGVVDTVFHFDKATGQYASVATNTATLTSGLIAPGGGEFFAVGPPKGVRIQNHVFTGTSSFRAVDSLVTGTAVTVPSGVSLDFRATNSTGAGITLRDGFTAVEGSTFSASVGPAPPAMLVRGDGTGVTGMVASREEGGGPATGPAHGGLDFAFEASEPNPFVATTTMRFALPAAERVRLEVYDTQGRRVRMLADRAFPAGRNQLQWDGTDASGHRVGAGIYLCQLRAGARQAIRKVTVLE